MTKQSAVFVAVLTLFVLCKTYTTSKYLLVELEAVKAETVARSATYSSSLSADFSDVEGTCGKQKNGCGNDQYCCLIALEEQEKTCIPTEQDCPELMSRAELKKRSGWGKDEGSGAGFRMLKDSAPSTVEFEDSELSLIHISEPTRPY